MSHPSLQEQLQALSLQTASFSQKGSPKSSPEGPVVDSSVQRRLNTSSISRSQSTKRTHEKKLTETIKNKQVAMLNQQNINTTNQKKKSDKSSKNDRIAWLERVRYGVELLKAYFPECFREGQAVVPLKVGIRQDLVLALSRLENIALADKACMVSSLSWYVNSFAYHQKVKAGVTRVDLNGQPAGIVTEEEAAWSQAKQQATQKKRQMAMTSPS